MDQLCAYLLDHFGQEFCFSTKNASLLYWASDFGGRIATLVIPQPPEHFKSPTSITNLEESLKVQFARDRVTRQLYNLGNEMQPDVPFFVIAFPDYPVTPGSTPSNSHMFFVSTECGKLPFRMINGDDLGRLIHSNLLIRNQVLGSSKPINKRYSDFFHWWSRTFTSGSITKTDIDGFIYSEKQRLLVEVKRSTKPPIPHWRPYRADMPDFILQCELADKLNARFVVLHHDSLPNAGALVSQNLVSAFWAARTSSAVSFNEEWNPVILDAAEDSLIARLDRICV